MSAVRPGPSLPPFPRRVVVLGSTGTVGVKALEIAARRPDRFRVVGIAARASAEKLAEQAARFRPERVVLADPARAGSLGGRLPTGTILETGPESLTRLAGSPDADVVVNAVVGAVGLEASLGALEAGKLLALANKESLVVGGELLSAAARRGGGTILPVDSEHSGLFQCLEGRDVRRVRRLILTASGGPFRGRGRDDLASVDPEEALRHPVWAMGPRITVDSATLMNKGLEVIETHWLFGVPFDRIAVWVHPQSVVHALIELEDGSLLAQLSTPDMTLPVQYAMSYPDRWESAVAPCRLPELGALTFEDPDREAFPALDLGFRAGRMGGTAPAVLNAADEVAVEAFLDRRLGFLELPALVAEVLERAPVGPIDGVESVVAADRVGRREARAVLERRSR